MQQLTKLLVIVTFSILTLSTQAQNFEWAAGLSCNNSNTYSNDVAIDKDGNTLLIGEFSGTMDIDPGISTQNIVSAGNRDIFLQKLDPNGNFIWGFRIGSNDYDEGNAVTTDSDGNVYIGGVFMFTADFNPLGTANNITSNTGRDAFVAKYSPAGQLIWVKTLQGNNWDYIDHIAIDTQKNIYLGGRFSSSPTDFDPGPGTFNLSNNGYLTGFVLKLDSLGNFAWAKDVAVTSTGTLDRSAVTGLDVSAAGEVFFTGNYRGAIDLDPGPGTQIDTAKGVDDIFIIQLDTQGNLVWGGTINGTDQEVSRGIAIDNSNNIYLTGYYQDSVDFDPSPTAQNWLFSSNRRYFLQKLAPNSGQVLWIKTFDFAPADITISAEEAIYLTGTFGNQVDFDLGPGSASLTASGIDAFLLKLDIQANFMWVAQTGGPSSDYAYALDVDDSSLAVANCGIFWGTVDFDSGTDTFSLTSNGFHDPYIQKYSQCITQTTSTTQVACGSFSWRGNTYTNSGMYYDTLTASSGCDSILELDLTINQPTTGTDVQTACGSYSWIDGNTYTSSNNTATFTLVGGAANGCDSTITLNLTINNSTTGTDVQTACRSYSWIDGNTYTSSNNTATFTIVGGAANGCDSVVTLDLTINTVDSTVSRAGGTLTANQTGGSYQWLDCDNGNAPITNATTQSYTPAATGNYAVEVTANGCSTISGCTNVVIAHTTNTANPMNAQLFPNPSKGDLQLNLASGHYQVQIAHISGQIVQQLEIRGSTTLTTQHIENGWYLFTITDLQHHRRQVLKFLKL